MLKNMTNNSFSLLGPSGKKSALKLEIENLSLSTRLFNALVKSGLLLVFGAFSVLIPLLHLILPFLFLGLATYLGLVTFKQKARIKSGEGNCPECMANFRIMARPCKFPFRDVCEGCKREIQIISEQDDKEAL